MIVQTPDGTYLWVETPFTSVYRVKPRVLSYDYDGDGEAELSIAGQFGLHGTGIYQESFLMADKDSQGEWKVYQLLDSWYLPEVEKYYETRHTKQGMELFLDGRKVGITMDTEGDDTYRYYGGNQIRVTACSMGIWLNFELLAYSDTDFVGNYYGNGLKMRLSYEGAGQWKAEECQYFARDLEETAKSAVSCYFSGDTASLNTYYKAEKAEALQASPKPMGVEIFRVTGKQEQLEQISEYMTGFRQGETVSLAVEVLAEDEDSFTYANLEMVYEPGAQEGEAGNFKVLDIGLEK